MMEGKVNKGCLAIPPTKKEVVNNYMGFYGRKETFYRIKKTILRLKRAFLVLPGEL